MLNNNEFAKFYVVFNLFISILLTPFSIVSLTGTTDPVALLVRVVVGVAVGVAFAWPMGWVMAYVHNRFWPWGVVQNDPLKLRGVK